MSTQLVDHINQMTLLLLFVASVVLLVHGDQWWMGALGGVSAFLFVHFLKSDLRRSVQIFVSKEEINHVVEMIIEREIEIAAKEKEEEGE